MKLCRENKALLLYSEYFFLSNSKLIFGSYLQWKGLVTISAAEYKVSEHAVCATHSATLAAWLSSLLARYLYNYGLRWKINIWSSNDTITELRSTTSHNSAHYVIVCISTVIMHSPVIRGPATPSYWLRIPIHPFIKTIKRQCVMCYNPCARMYHFQVTVTSPLVDKIDSAQNCITGRRWDSWLKHSSTNRKVAGSVPVWHNPNRYE